MTNSEFPNVKAHLVKWKKKALSTQNNPRKKTKKQAA
jgi:hypothetical protein